MLFFLGIFGTQISLLLDTIRTAELRGKLSAGKFLSLSEWQFSLIEFDINSSLFFFSTFRHLPNGLKHKAVKTKKINFKITPPPLSYLPLHFRKWIYFNCFAEKFAFNRKKCPVYWRWVYKKFLKKSWSF